MTSLQQKLGSFQTSSFSFNEVTNGMSHFESGSSFQLNASDKRSFITGKRSERKRKCSNKNNQIRTRKQSQPRKLHSMHTLMMSFEVFLPDSHDFLCTSDYIHMAVHSSLVLRKVMTYVRGLVVFVRFSSR